MDTDENLIPGVDYDEECCYNCGTTDPAACTDECRNDPFPSRGYPYHDEDEDEESCLNCDKPISHGSYCSTTCEGMDRLPSPRND